MNSIKDIKKFYDDAIYRKLHGFIYNNSRVEYAWQSLISIFKYATPKRILEIGSGIGEVSFRLALRLPEASVVGFDISEKSVKIARDLFELSNLEFSQADRVVDAGLDRNGKFDLIFLMDVYEHIPVCSRAELHQFIKQNISRNGFLFLSCPTAHHLDYLRKNKPEEIQPVDENITLKELIQLENETHLNLISYKEASVWRSGDYFHAIFSNQNKMQAFSDFEVESGSKSIGLKNEIIKKVANLRRKNIAQESVTKKKYLIAKNLGHDILKKAENHKVY